MTDNAEEKRGGTTSKSDMRTQAFQMALEMVAVFGIPAVIAVVVGRKLVQQFGWPSWITFGLLGLAFVVSWVIVYVRVRKLRRQLRESEKSAGDTTNSK